MRGSLRRLVCTPLALVWLWPAHGQQPAPPQRQKPSVTATIDNASSNEVPQLYNQLKENQARLHAFESENEGLRRLNEQRQKTIRALNESLAVAKAESEFFKRSFGELQLRMEALGLASVGDNKEALEQRLLKAVRDLDLTRQDKEKLAERLVALSETVMLAFKTATLTDPQLRLDVEEQLRSASQALDAAKAQNNGSSGRAPGDSDPAQQQQQPADLSNGHVISVKEDYSLLVADLGSKQGVKVGMPFQIVRGNKAVGRARVVDVRERISGAIVEEYSSNSEKVKVGDQLRVDARP